VLLFVQDYNEQRMGAISIVMKNPGLESIGILLRGSLYTLKEPHVLHYVMKDHNLLPRDIYIYI